MVGRILNFVPWRFLLALSACLIILAGQSSMARDFTLRHDLDVHEFEGRREIDPERSIARVMIAGDSAPRTLGQYTIRWPKWYENLQSSWSLSQTRGTLKFYWREDIDSTLHGSTIFAFGVLRDSENRLVEVIPLQSVGRITETARGIEEELEIEARLESVLKTLWEANSDSKRVVSIALFVIEKTIPLISESEKHWESLLQNFEQLLSRFHELSEREQIDTLIFLHSVSKGEFHQAHREDFREYYLKFILEFLRSVNSSSDRVIMELDRNQNLSTYLGARLIEEVARDIQATESVLSELTGWPDRRSLSEPVSFQCAVLGASAMLIERGQEGQQKGQHTKAENLREITSTCYRNFLFQSGIPREMLPTVGSCAEKDLLFLRRDLGRGIIKVWPTLIEVEPSLRGAGASWRDGTIKDIAMDLFHCGAEGDGADVEKE